MRINLVASNPYEKFEALSYNDYRIMVQIKGLGAKAYTVLPYTREAEAKISEISLPANIAIACLDGWDGSYHDAHYDSGKGIVVYVTSKRGGWMGKLRKATKMVMAAIANNKANPEILAAQDAWLLGSMIHRGIVSREGD